MWTLGRACDRRMLLHRASAQMTAPQSTAGTSAPRRGSQCGEGPGQSRWPLAQSGQWPALRAATAPTSLSWGRGDPSLITGRVRFWTLDQRQAGEQSPSGLTPDDPACVPYRRGAPRTGSTPPYPTSCRSEHPCMGNACGRGLCHLSLPQSRVASRGNDPGHCHWGWGAGLCQGREPHEPSLEPAAPRLLGCM